LGDYKKGLPVSLALSPFTTTATTRLPSKPRQVATRISGVGQTYEDDDLSIIDSHRKGAQIRATASILSPNRP